MTINNFQKMYSLMETHLFANYEFRDHFIIEKSKEYNGSDPCSFFTAWDLADLMSANYGIDEVESIAIIDKWINSVTGEHFDRFEIVSLPRA